MLQLCVQSQKQNITKNKTKKSPILRPTTKNKQTKKNPRKQKQTEEATPYSSSQ